MNKEQLLAAAEVMRRAAEGEPVQAYVYMDCRWQDVPDPTWAWEITSYRIKPRKPREVFIAEEDIPTIPTSVGSCYFTISPRASAEQRNRIRKFREVVE